MENVCVYDIGPVLRINGHLPTEYDIKRDSP